MDQVRAKSQETSEQQHDTEDNTSRLYFELTEEQKRISLSGGLWFATPEQEQAMRDHAVATAKSRQNTKNLVAAKVEFRGDDG